ncbi:MAG: HAD-IA family hydrolase [Hyphomicrobiaceae bacterium]
MGLALTADALVFDLDGTLVDTTRIIDTIWRQWSAEYGRVAEQVVKAAKGRQTIETLRDFAPPGMDLEAEARRLQMQARAATTGAVAIAGAEAFLSQIPSDRWAIVTSAERELAERWLMQAGLPVPSVLISAGDVARSKPDPEGYLLAASRLAVAAGEMLVFEDSMAGLTAATRAGARCVQIGGEAKLGGDANVVVRIEDYLEAKLVAEPPRAEMEIVLATA